LRIIAGMAKGRRLKTPKGFKTRPTSARVRESLFNILGARIIGRAFLDLFAGSGVLGIEALSRGAARCVFIEKQPRNARLIRENLAISGLAELAQVYTMDVLKGISVLGREGERFPIITLDPPYGSPIAQRTVDALVQWDLCPPGGLIIIEQSTKDLIDLDEDKGFDLWRRESYGGTSLAFFVRRGGELSS
jgi:16S rRNA (guanine966-N2)-methyltransferase